MKSTMKHPLSQSYIQQTSKTCQNFLEIPSMGLSSQPNTVFFRERLKYIYLESKSLFFQVLEALKVDFLVYFLSPCFQSRTFLVYQRKPSKQFMVFNWLQGSMNEVFVLNLTKTNQVFLPFNQFIVRSLFQFYNHSILVYLFSWESRQHYLITFVGVSTWIWQDSSPQVSLSFLQSCSNWSKERTLKRNYSTSLQMQQISKQQMYKMIAIIRHTKKLTSEQKIVAPRTKIMMAIIRRHVARTILASIWKLNSMGSCSFQRFWFTFRLAFEF